MILGFYVADRRRLRDNRGADQRVNWSWMQVRKRFLYRCFLPAIRCTANTVQLCHCSLKITLNQEGRPRLSTVITRQFGSIIATIIVATYVNAMRFRRNAHSEISDSDRRFISRALQSAWKRLHPETDKGFSRPLRLIRDQKCREMWDPRFLLPSPLLLALSSPSSFLPPSTALTISFRKRIKHKAPFDRAIESPANANALDDALEHFISASQISTLFRIFEYMSAIVS